jgi:hypothetical protein
VNFPTSCDKTERKENEAGKLPNSGSALADDGPTAKHRADKRCLRRGTRGPRTWRRRGARRGRGGRQRAWWGGAGPRRCVGGTPTAAAASLARRPRAVRGSRARTAPPPLLRRPRLRIRSWHESQPLGHFLISTLQRISAAVARLAHSLPTHNKKDEADIIARKRASGNGMQPRTRIDKIKPAHARTEYQEATNTISKMKPWRTHRCYICCIST